MTNTDKFWEDIDLIINDAISEIENVVMNATDQKIPYRGYVKGDLRANYIYYSEDYGEVWVNYNVMEETPLRMCEISDILNVHETLSYEFD